MKKIICRTSIVREKTKYMQYRNKRKKSLAVQKQTQKIPSLFHATPQHSSTFWRARTDVRAMTWAIQSLSGVINMRNTLNRAKTHTRAHKTFSSTAYIHNRVYGRQNEKKNTSKVICTICSISVPSDCSCTLVTSAAIMASAAPSTAKL